MLAKKYILKEKKIFQALKYKGEREKIGAFLFSYFRGQLKHNRFGIVISQRSVNKAVKRNQIKRKIRALLFPFRRKKSKKGTFVEAAVVVLYEPSHNDYQRFKFFLKKFFI